MGKRGPAPKPTALRLLHGDQKSRINQDEPPTPEGLPQCPAEVSPDVREVWEFAMRNLVVMGVATPPDRDALLCYCEAVITHRRASAILADGSLIISGLHGGPVTNPAARLQRDAATTIRAFAREFGFTPSARSEIHQTGASSGPPAARYLNGA